jgi:hypothetical protein
MKQNYWEAENCGREAGGVHAKEPGVCAASGEVKLDGMHHGKNAGRACWVVAGTFCSGKPQGNLLKIIINMIHAIFITRSEKKSFRLLPQPFNFCEN